MKAGYIAPMSIAAVNGGIRTQAMFTVEHVRKHGVEPVLISPWEDLRKLNLDFIHVFGASVENEGIIKQIKALGMPLVLSPVFYSNRSAAFIKVLLKLEYLSSTIGSKVRTDFSTKANLCTLADLILPNTPDEADLIEKGFSIPSNKISVVPNGVEKKFTDASPELFKEKYGLDDFVLFAGQAGAPRKNVFNLLEIAGKIDVPVVIIGSLYEDDYGRKCLELAKKAGNVTLIDTLDHDDELLASAYAACKVFVLPSQFETPGIAAMEAALARANIVITKQGGTKYYFEDHAEYVDPKSTSSLLQGIKKAITKGSSDTLRNHILTHFTWNKVAEATANYYKELLK